MSKKCIVMVGLPGSGKSETVKAYKTDDTFVYSTDNELEGIAKSRGKTYDEVFREYFKLAKGLADEGLNAAIEMEQNVIFDQTNLGSGKRRGIVQRMKNLGYRVECVYVVNEKKHAQEWGRRLEAREGKTIPVKVILEMIENMEEPTVDEGFDKLTKLDIYGAYI